MTRLETVRAPKSSIDQRRGRAGRTEPGLCVRLWHEGQTGSLPQRPDPQISQADLTQLVLDMAAWGVTNPDGLSWIDTPPRAAWDGARSLLMEIGALASDGTLTARGRALGAFPLHPRLAHMIAESTSLGLSPVLAAEIAAILSEPGLTGRRIDLRDRLAALRSANSKPAAALRRQARDWVARAGSQEAPAAAEDAGIVLALAYPDRIARARGNDGTFKLANGKGCVVDEAEPLSRAPYLVVADLAGRAANARVQLAAPIELADITRHFGSRIVRQEALKFDDARNVVIAETRETLGALTLKRTQKPAEPGEDAARILASEITRRGFSCLPFETGVDAYCARIAFLRANGEDDLPDITPGSLLATLDDWLQPFLIAATGLNDLDKPAFASALSIAVGDHVSRRVARLAPREFTLPSGGTASIDYLRDGGPGIAAIPHAFFGEATHPSILGGRYPLAVTLLSPAGRPLQVTRDLIGFWAGSWREVRAELRSRYPKHHWPEHPTREQPSSSSIKRR